MFLKIIGGILVVLSCGLLGISTANKYTGRPREIRYFRRTIQLLETEILYGATPLPQAFEGIANKIEGYLNDFYSNVSKGLICGIHYNFKEVWQQEVNALHNTNLSNADKELIIEFGNVLGSSDRQDQEKHFKLFYKQLELYEEQAEEDKRKNEKMYRNLGFLLGVTIFVFLI